MSQVQHSEVCCTLPPFKGSNYKPIGEVVRIPDSDIDVYLTGKKDSEIALICIYDIFGIVNTTQQGADILATELGARIAMPDLFKGKPWDITNFPPPDRNEFLSWLGKTQWPQVEPVLIKTIAYLRESGAKKFGTHTVLMVADVGLYGFCWGGKMAISATKHVRAAALVHPAFIEVSDAEKAVVPICLLDSKDEDKETMDKFIGEIKKKPFGNKVFRKRYDIFHGFCAGRANYGDEDNAKKANEAYSDLAEFFKANLT